MVVKIIHRVFVSSTYEDLREERAAVQMALLKLDFFPVGMELFPSANDETWNFIKKQIEASDYYLVIVAGRYGSEAADGKSYTQKEWEYAREIGKPTIAFLYANPSNIIAGKTEQDPQKKEKLAAFIALLRRSPVTTFNDANELAMQVMASMINLRESYPVAGYVRQDEVVDYKKYADLLEENRTLKEQLATTAKQEPFPGAAEKYNFIISYADIKKTGTVMKQTNKELVYSNILAFYVELLLDGINTNESIAKKITYIIFYDHLKTINKSWHSSINIKDIDYISKLFFSIGLISYSVVEKELKAEFDEEYSSTYI